MRATSSAPEKAMATSEPKVFRACRHEIEARHDTHSGEADSWEKRDLKLLATAC
jgi:hypothetical protein